MVRATIIQQPRYSIGSPAIAIVALCAAVGGTIALAKQNAIQNAAPVMALDRLALKQVGQRQGANSQEIGEDFPGSAYFLAEDAFQAQPAARTDSQEPHVVLIDPHAPLSALPFRGLTAVDRARAQACLTAGIYYEAANEPEVGQRAVAQVILNRVRHPDWPNSVCGVVYQGTERTDWHCQFTFTCNGAMARKPSRDGWSRARRIAERALNGEVYAPVGLATYYHTLAIRPDWSGRMRPVGIFGAHIFYRPPGADGEATAFTDRYSGRESGAGPSINAYVDPRTTRGDVSDLQLPPTVAEALILPSPAPTRLPLPASMSQQSTLPQSTIRAEYRNSGRIIPQ